MQPIISAKKVTKKFNQVIAVNQVDMEIYPYNFYCIMGRSGSGKTTLLSLMGLLDSPTDGNILFEDSECSELNSYQKAKIRMNILGFVFQDFHLNPSLKAYENVMLPMLINKNIEEKEMKNRAVQLLEKFELGHRINHKPAELSGGEKQRVALARALANDPQVILADEPTGNLDIKSEELVFKHLKLLSEQGKAIVVVSHNPTAREYADVIFEMNEGFIKEVSLR